GRHGRHRLDDSEHQRELTGGQHYVALPSLSFSALSSAPPLLAAHNAPVAAASCITVCSSSHEAPARRAAAACACAPTGLCSASSMPNRMSCVVFMSITPE